MRLRTIVAGLCVAVLAFAGALLAMQVLWPASVTERQPALAAVPPLPPATGTSVIIAPTVITLTAIRDALEAHAPRDLAGRANNPAPKYISKADINWTVSRGPLAVYGKPETLAATTALSGTLRATGTLSAQTAGRLGNAISGLLGEDAARTVEKLAGRPIDQRTDIRGTVVAIARPVLTSDWRLEPNLAGQVSVADATMSIAGIRLNVGNEVKPLLERQVNEQVARLETRLRSDPLLEQAARREWAKLCRSFAIGAAGAGLPNLWLELRPTRAIAAQPQVDGESVTLVVGFEAQTRIVPQESKPDCPFPDRLDIVPHAAGRVSVAVPIDVPFSEVNRLMQAQLVGRTFPEDRSAAAAVTVRSARVAASGDRLLFSLRVRATERTSWFGLGTEADVHIWGRPVLDAKAQVLRLANVVLDLESEGVLGAAAGAAASYLRDAVAERAVIDLRLFAVNARRHIEAAIGAFRAAGEGVRVDAAVRDLRIAGIAFDATTLRIVAEADGDARVSVTKLPDR